ncbi:putative bifunctional diguanylate cyclase/phosphodiesterase [Sideroxydans lithotrophicus]|nr:bifunctional diguanylate cyclase/phosphodiesterase [Sideroxydans lithotrophicus]
MYINPSLQAKLENSERMLKALLNNLDGMVYCCLYDADWTMVFVGDGCKQLTGYDAQAFVSSEICLEAITIPEDREPVNKAIGDAISNGKRFAVEYRIIHADGRTRWVSERGCPLYDDNGEVEAIEGFMQDVTQRKLSEVAARDAEERYRSIFENALEGIYQTTPDGHYLNFNPALARIYGYESAVDLVCSISDIQQQLYVDPDKRQEFITLMNVHGQVSNFEAQVYRKGGEIIWISENAHEVKDRDGKLLFYEGTVEDITERKNYEQQIEYQATHDALTGLPNRTLLADRLQQYIGIADRYTSKLAVAFVDLDQFKLINDSMGHHAGDELLKIMAARLASCVRESDTVVRLGGDEFVLLLTGLHKIEDISESMQRVLSSVAGPCTIEDRDFVVSCSIGISIYPDDARDTTTLLKYADSAMYKSKQSGRNNFQFYTDELNQRLMERLDLEYRLRLALENEEFLLHYQPKLALVSGAICGAEALIRWQPAGESMISPASFIPIAEETGLIEDIGLWVLHEACRQAVKLNRLYGRELPIAVNVSPRQFRQSDLVSMVRSALLNSGLNPACLELEITESSLVHDTGSFIKTLQELKNLGVGLAIDDFGTGYSSMAYLKDFPVDRLKIDQVFVSNLEAEPSNIAILKAIVALGHSLNMKVIAEGVETAYQKAFLLGIGCDEMQGYHFSKPLHMDTFGKLLSDSCLKN